MISESIEAVFQGIADRQKDLIELEVQWDEDNKKLEIAWTPLVTDKKTIHDLSGMAYLLGDAVNVNSLDIDVDMKSHKATYTFLNVTPALSPTMEDLCHALDGRSVSWDEG